MANPTINLIASQVLGSNATSVTFSSIPSSYTDLKLICSIRTTRANSDPSADILITFNGAGGTAYSTKELRANGSTVTTAGTTSVASITSLLGHSGFGTASTFSTAEVYIPNYLSSTGKAITIDTADENNATLALMQLAAGYSSNTAAITSITIADGNSSNLVQYSSFYLYGISNS